MIAKSEAAVGTGMGLGVVAKSMERIGEKSALNQIWAMAAGFGWNFNGHLGRVRLALNKQLADRLSAHYQSPVLAT